MKSRQGMWQRRNFLFVVSTMLLIGLFFLAANGDRRVSKSAEECLKQRSPESGETEVSGSNHRRLLRWKKWFHKEVNGNEQSSFDTITVKCVTWNMGNQEKIQKSKTRDDLSSLVKEAKINDPDLIVFGFQEACYGPSDRNYYQALKCKLLHRLGAFYKFTHGKRLGGVFCKGTYLMIFKKMGKGIDVSKVSIKNVNGGTWRDITDWKNNRSRRFGKKGQKKFIKKITANKGAVLLKMKIKCKSNGKTCEVGFLNCHNSSDDAQENRSNFVKCMEMLEGNSKVSLDCKNFVFMGDLNPRMTTRNIRVSDITNDQQGLKTKRQPGFPDFMKFFNTEAQTTARNRVYQDVFENAPNGDIRNTKIENKRTRRDHDSIFDLFEQYPGLKEFTTDGKGRYLPFRPSYPAKPNDKFYGPNDNAKKRIACHTDRILYKGDSIKCDKYEMMCNVLGSDHRPVYADFTLTLGLTSNQSQKKKKYTGGGHWIVD